MIGVDRGEEPDELAHERSYRLAYVSIHKKRPENDKIRGYDPDSVKKRLIERQFGSCAYCGKFIEGDGDPIDHFRPKSYAKVVNWDKLPPEPVDNGEFFRWFDDHLGSDAPDKKRQEVWLRDNDRYWWLAWTWENLFYACGTCNSQAYKGNCFPLEKDTNSLSLNAQPPGDEKPLLLDPARYDPLDHLRFTPDLAAGGWAPIPLTPVGRWTMAILGLHNRPSLRTVWTNCALDIENNSGFKEFFETISQSLDINDLLADWTALKEALIDQRTDYRTLRWCVFDHYFRKHKLKTRGLDLPRPWKINPATPSAIFKLRPELDPFPENLQLRIRALPGKFDDQIQKDEFKIMLVDLCKHKPFTIDELAKITGLKTLKHLLSHYLAPLTQGAEPRLAYDVQTKTYRSI